MTLPCRYSAGLAALDLTARGPCVLGFAVVCGVGASSTPFSALPAGLVGLLELAAERLVLSTPSGGAAETAGGRPSAAPLCLLYWRADRIVFS